MLEKSTIRYWGDGEKANWNQGNGGPVLYRGVKHTPVKKAPLPYSPAVERNHWGDGEKADWNQGNGGPVLIKAKRDTITSAPRIAKLILNKKYSDNKIMRIVKRAQVVKPNVVTEKVKITTSDWSMGMTLGEVANHVKRGNLSRWLHDQAERMHYIDNSQDFVDMSDGPKNAAASQ